MIFLTAHQTDLAISSCTSILINQSERFAVVADFERR